MTAGWVVSTPTDLVWCDSALVALALELEAVRLYPAELIAVERVEPAREDA